MKHIHDDARRHAYNTLDEVNRHLNTGKVRNPRHREILSNIKKNSLDALDRLDRLDDRYDDDYDDAEMARRRKRVRGYTRRTPRYDMDDRDDDTEMRTDDHYNDMRRIADDAADRTRRHMRSDIYPGTPPVMPHHDDARNDHHDQPIGPGRGR